MGSWQCDRVAHTRANKPGDTHPMPNRATRNRWYAEAARPQDTYKRFSMCVVLCRVVHRAVDKSVDMFVYVCVHTRFVLLLSVSVC